MRLALFYGPFYVLFKFNFPNKDCSFPNKLIKKSTRKEEAEQTLETSLLVIPFYLVCFKSMILSAFCHEEVSIKDKHGLELIMKQEREQ